MSPLKHKISRQFFWRNQSITAQRIKDILYKARTRGGGWFFERLGKEFRTPETLPGVHLRSVLVGLANVMVFVLSPVLFFAARLFWQSQKTLYYFYDLDVSPITFDVADYLALAELERRMRGLDRLYIVIVPGCRDGLRDEGGEYEKLVDRSTRLWRLNNLVIPLFALVPSCSGYSVCRDRRQATLFRILSGQHVFPQTYWPAFPLSPFRRPILESARQGVPVFPVFRSPEQGLRYVRRWLEAHVGAKKPITITIRYYRFDPARNSNLDAWVIFARSLNPDEFVPVFVLDTEIAMEPTPEVLKEFLVFSEAPWNLALRCALYELAYVNLAIVHGPTELLWYNDRCRYVIFFPSPNSSQTGEEYMKSNGFIHGESLPFAGSFQKWVWEPDDAQTIKREFDRICKDLEGAAVSSDATSKADVTLSRRLKPN